MVRPDATTGFAHVETWVFDLDNTLYPADCNLFAQIDRRMGEFIANSFGIPFEDAQRIREIYYYEHGTTLAGLMRLHDICPHSFLDYVHDIDLSVVAAAPELGDAIEKLPGRKFIFTNGSRKHAEAVSARLGLHDHFDDIFDIHALEYIYPKPMAEAYERFTRAHGIAAAAAAMFDDLPHNLEAAHRIGMTTVLVDGATTPHPEHQAIAGWETLPPYIDRRTDALTVFLAEIGARLETGPRQLHFPPPVPAAEPAPPQGGSEEKVAALCFIA